MTEFRVYNKHGMLKKSVGDAPLTDSEPIPINIPKEVDNDGN